MFLTNFSHFLILLQDFLYTFPILMPNLCNKAGDNAKWWAFKHACNEFTKYVAIKVELKEPEGMQESQNPKQAPEEAPHQVLIWWYS